MLDRLFVEKLTEELWEAPMEIVWSRQDLQVLLRALDTAPVQGLAYMRTVTATAAKVRAALTSMRPSPPIDDGETDRQGNEE